METEDIPEEETEETIDNDAIIIERLITLQQSTADIINRIDEIERIINERLSTRNEPEPITEPDPITEPPIDPQETRSPAQEPDKRIKPQRKHAYFRKLW